MPCWKQSVGIGKSHAQHLISLFHTHNAEQGILYFFKGKTTSAEHSDSRKLGDAWVMPNGCEDEKAFYNGPAKRGSVSRRSKRNQAPGNAASNDL